MFDGKVGDGAGGTSTIVNVWAGLARRGRSRGKAALDLHLIDIEAIRGGTPLRWCNTAASPTKIPPSVMVDDSNDSMELGSIMFGDVKGFGGLHEEYMPLFVQIFLGLAAEMDQATHKSRRASVRNTGGGDRLYFVSEKVRMLACSRSNSTTRLLVPIGLNSAFRISFSCASACIWGQFIHVMNQKRKP